MGLCTTGSLSICGTAGTNRSISTEVGTGSGSLSALSTSAGKGSPHSMLEFYGYSNLIYTDVNLVTISCTQTLNGNWLACINGDSCTGSCYDLTIFYNVVKSNHFKNTAYVCVACNTVCKYGCSVDQGDFAAGCFPSFTVNATDCVCFYTVANGLIEGSSAFAQLCINAVDWVAGSSTCYSIGTPSSIQSFGGDG